MGTAQPILKYTLAEYLAFEERSEMKHEYYAGDIYAMAGASPTHNQLCFNLGGLLFASLKGSECRGFTSDQKIWIEAAGLTTYPDLTIVCGQAQYDSEHLTLLTNPRLIVEVLSPSTMAYDRGEKWAFYQQLPSLQEYLMVWQDRPQIEQYSRQSDDSWRYLRVAGLEQTLTLASLSCELLLAEIYSGIEFPPPKSPRPPIQIVPD
ncbi:MAG: Uma2 family endonuclease [Blastocatellia bacterium]|nr:Uma2 family endonuclease [Blastocatellia bacterium]